MVKRMVLSGLAILLFGLGLYGSAHTLEIQRERGDVNGDGAIDVLDAVLAINIVLGTSPPPSGEELWAADCNGDGGANVLDALGIVNVILGLGTCVSSCDEVDCDDGNPCTEDFCDPLLVQCRHDPLEDGAPCDDGDPHTENDMCVDGICQGTPRDLAEELQEALDTALERYNGMGASAAVIIPGHEPWLGASGVSHDSVPITSDMVFGIGSVTKSFTAALVLKLAEEGLLTLEDPLHQWLPSFPNIDSTITIQQLLNHTSGLQCFYNNDEMWEAIESGIVRDWTPEEILSYVPEPYFPPGTGWHYSNANYILLGMIVKEATGSSVSTEFRNRLWEPLGLHSTCLAAEETLSAPVAHFWWRDNGGHLSDLTDTPGRINQERVGWTSGGVYATAEDIATWSQSLYGGEVLNNTYTEKLLTFVPTADFHAPGYGCGVVSYYPDWANGEASIGHTGGFIAHMTYMVYLPHYDASITVMVNDWNSDCIDAMKDDLIEVVLHHLLNSSCACPSLDPFQTRLVYDLETSQDTEFWSFSTPEEEGMDKDLLEAGVAALAELSNLYSVLILRNDKIVLEQYVHGEDLRHARNIQSASKSFISALVGIAIQEGYIQSVDQTAAEFLPLYFHSVQDPRKLDITLHNLLTMTPGFFYQDCLHCLQGDWIATAISYPIVSEPGSNFNYSTISSHILSAILTKATGMSTCAFACQYLFQPIGITIDNWSRDPQGYNMGGIAMYFATRELAKFGLLYLHDGVWNGRQVIPSEWIAQSMTGHVTDTGYPEVSYGYYWWLENAAGYPVYAAVGHGGQTIRIVPDLNLVVVTTADSFAPDQGIDLFPLLEEYVIPAIHDAAPQ